MKVTSKTMYTLHFLTALAIRSTRDGQGPVHLREIAEEYNIPFKFLEQIAILMKGVGLVKGARGKTGGYQLAEPAESISLLRIIRATEGQVLPCSEIEGGKEAVNAPVRTLFAECRQSVEEKLNAMTLAQLADRARAQLEPVVMYYL